MIPQVEDVYNLTRYHCGDTAVPGGQTFQDSFLVQLWPSAFSGLYRWLDRNANKLIRRTFYYNVPANTQYLLPSSIGIGSIGKPVEMYERPVGIALTGTIAAINAASPGSPPSVDITTSSPHGLITGAQVVTFNFGWDTATQTDDQGATTVTDDINAQWYITVLGASSLRLNGCAAQDLGNAVGSTGIVSTSPQTFGNYPIYQLYDYSGESIATQNSQLTSWKWENGAFWFVPANQARQVKIIIMLSGAPPMSGSVGIDDSLDALALFLGAAACQAKGFRAKSQDLSMRAVGNPSLDTTNVKGGVFYELAQLGLQEINETTTLMPRFRGKRNVGPYQNGSFIGRGF